MAGAKKVKYRAMASLRVRKEERREVSISQEPFPAAQCCPALDNLAESSQGP